MLVHLNGCAQALACLYGSLGRLVIAPKQLHTYTYSLLSTLIFAPSMPSVSPPKQLPSHPLIDLHRNEVGLRNDPLHTHFQDYAPTPTFNFAPSIPSACPTNSFTHICFSLICTEMKWACAMTPCTPISKIMLPHPH